MFERKMFAANHWIIQSMMNDIVSKSQCFLLPGTFSFIYRNNIITYFPAFVICQIKIIVLLAHIVSIYAMVAPGNVTMFFVVFHICVNAPFWRTTFIAR